MDNINLHLHFYGDMVVAKQLIPTAKRIANKLSLRNRNAIDSVTESVGESVITVTRVNDQYSAVIYGATQKQKTIVPPVVSTASVKVLAGYVTDPSIIGSADTGANEFSPCRQYRANPQVAVVREPEPKLSTRPSGSWGIGDPNASTYSQAGYITPSMFSGKMCELVQLALGIDGKIVVNNIPFRLPGVQFASFFGLTHGLVQDKSNQKWYVVSISPAGISLSNILFVSDFIKDNNLPSTSFGGYPTGVLSPPFRIIATAEDMKPLYDGSTPPIDSTIGWSFNDDGSECRLVIAYWVSDTVLKSRVVQIKFTINSASRVFHANVKVSESCRLADPTPWWHALKGAPWSAPKFPVTEGVELIMYGGASEYPVFMHQPLRLLFDWADAKLATSPTPFTEGVDTSWFATRPPISLWIRGNDITGARGYVKYPAIPPERDAAIDAPIHVVFHNGSFVTYQYFWTFDVPNSPLPFNSAQGLLGRGESNGVYGLTWYQKQLCYGTPPTIYTNLKDTRERRAFLTAAIDPYWEYLATASDAEKDFTNPDKTGFELFGYRTKTEWAFHSGIIIPYMCRDAVIETTFDSAGWARVNDNGKLVGSDFGVAFPATSTVVHEIKLFFGLPPYYWYGIDGLYPDVDTVLDMMYYDAIARGEIDLHADILAPNSIWAWLKKQKLVVGAKTIPLRSSGNFPTAAWDASTLTTAPRHTAVKDIERPWKARKFVFDACDYTTYAVAAKEAPTCGANSVWLTGVYQALRVVAFKGEWLPHKGLVADKSLPLCGYYKPTMLAGRKNVFVGKYPVLMEHDFINYIGEYYGNDTFPRLFTMLASSNVATYPMQDWWNNKDKAWTYSSFPVGLSRELYWSKTYAGIYRSLWDDNSKAVLKTRRTWGSAFKIPGIDRGNVIAMLCPNYMQGAGAGVSYLGDIAMFLRGKGVIWAHGAIPNGLVLEPDDVICMVGEIKNG